MSKQTTTTPAAFGKGIGQAVPTPKQAQEKLALEPERKGDEPKNDGAVQLSKRSRCKSAREIVKLLETWNVNALEIVEAFKAELRPAKFEALQEAFAKVPRIKR